MTTLNLVKPDQQPPSVLQPKRSPWIALAISLAVFLILQFLLLTPQLGAKYQHRGSWYIEKEGVTVPWNLPFSKKIYQTESLEIRTLLPATEGLSLVFNGLDATALTAWLNDVEIFRIGDHEQPTANIWNSTVAIPLPDTENANNRFEMKLTGNHVISVKSLPRFYATSRALQIEQLSLFLTSNILRSAMGASVVVGILLIGFSVNRRKKGLDGYLLGISCFLVSFYAFEYTFRTSTGPLVVYNILKRLMIISGYLASFTFLAGLDFQRNQKFTVTRWMLIPTAFSAILIASAPNLGLLISWLIPLNIVLITNLIVVIIIVFKDPKYRPLHLIAAGIVGLALIQITVAISADLSLPVVLQYGVLVTSIFFGLQFLFDFRVVYQEREKLAKSYNRDTLTEAYNRRALGDINMALFSSAVFLDLDAFKYYNDRYGHDRGDEVLKGFVDLARSLLRQDDIVVRYGGDEFLILLKEADERAVRGVVERIRRHFRNSVNDSRIDISYGISLIGPGGTLDIEDLDRKMYSMKNKRKKS